MKNPLKACNRWLLLMAAVVIFSPAVAQSGFGDYYDCRFAAHQKEGMPHGAIVWLGDSITEQGWWDFLSDEEKIVNRGIGGDNTRGMLARLDEILAFEPRKIFFMGGVNDLSGNRPVEEVAENIAQIVEMIRREVPSCEIYLQSLIPLNEDVLAYPYARNKKAQVVELNRRLKALCDEGKAIWVDVAALLVNERGEVREELTKDGIHLHPEAYRIWVDHLKKMNYLQK